MGAACRKLDHPCGVCHGSSDPRVPGKETLQSLTVSRIVRTLNFGSMMSIGSGLTGDEKQAVAAYLGKAETAAAVLPARAYCANREVRLTGQTQYWNGWSPAAAAGSAGTNNRYQTTGALSLSQVGRLRLKWAFGMEGDLSAFAPPAIIGNHLFVGSASGRVNALDATTGCIRWSFQADGPVRAAIAIAPIANGHVLLFGDLTGWFYAVAAETGRLLWRQRPEAHEATRLTGAAAVWDGVVYVPAASWEEARSLNGDYPCCTFRGSVTAFRVLARPRVAWPK